MWLNLIKRMSASLRRGTTGEDNDGNDAHGPREPQLAALLGETSWHGDHWANLLSAPMDARHYVLEDWSTPRPLGAFET
jgi:hypothetical protein